MRSYLYLPLFILSALSVVFIIATNADAEEHFDYEENKNFSISTSYLLYIQGCAVNDTRIFTTSKTASNTYPGSLNVFDFNGNHIDGRDLSENTDHVTHVSDLYQKDGLLYVADIYPYPDTAQYRPYVVRFYASNLTFKDVFINNTDSIGGNYTAEGITYYNNSWWLTFHGISVIQRYNNNGTFIKEYDIPDASSDPVGYDGTDFIEYDNRIFCFLSIHRSPGGLKILEYHPSNDSFTLFQDEYDNWTFINQGMMRNGSLNSSVLWIADRGASGGSPNYLREISFTLNSGSIETIDSATFTMEATVSDNETPSPSLTLLDSKTFTMSAVVWNESVNNGSGFTIPHSNTLYYYVLAGMLVFFPFLAIVYKKWR